ncbi:MAG: hypothetical protein IPJ34_20505 [Myxococcales bacterium]|nr:hypothetical protein [Myxococcales bacterium]
MHASFARPLLVGLALVVVPAACSRRDEPNPPAPGVVPGAGSVDKSMAPPPLTVNPAVLRPKVPGTAASAFGLGVGFGFRQRLASASGSASASASGSAVAASPLVGKVLGYWKFARFDLTDKATAERWAKVPPPTQIQILSEAPQATMEITPNALVSRLPGVPDKTVNFTVLTEADPDLTVKTADGKKLLRVLDADNLRVEDLDKKDGLVAIFTRKKLGIAPPAPIASSAKPK